MLILLDLGTNLEYNFIMKIVKDVKHVRRNTLLLDLPHLALANVCVSKAELWMPGTRLSDRGTPAIIANGEETIESFLSRGGSITKCAPCTKGMNKTNVRVKGSRNFANTQMKMTRSVKSIENNQ